MAALIQPLVFQEEVFLQQMSRGCEPQVRRSGPCEKSVRLGTCVAELWWRLTVGGRVEEVEVEVEVGWGCGECGAPFPTCYSGGGADKCSEQSALLKPHIFIFYLFVCLFTSPTPAPRR